MLEIRNHAECFINYLTAVHFSFFLHGQRARQPRLVAGDGAGMLFQSDGPVVKPYVPSNRSNKSQVSWMEASLLTPQKTCLHKQQDQHYHWKCSHWNIIEISFHVSEMCHGDGWLFLNYNSNSGELQMLRVWHCFTRKKKKKNLAAKPSNPVRI